ncbi:MAG: HD domain-containing protein, partial [Oscillospiraceae bacterium]|nr:HD domain-containing protein [Oscillospiraceae bacterium]
VSNYHGKNAAIKLALLFHDIGKPHCYTEDERGGHFYGHAKISLDIAKRVLPRLRLDNKTRIAAEELILHHDTPIMPTEKAVKKWLSRIGEERLRELIEVKRADVAAQNPETVGERLSEFDEILRLIDRIINAGECFSLSDLAIDGNGVVELGVPRGREVGNLLSRLLDEVISGELENEKTALEERVRKLKKL